MKRRKLYGTPRSPEIDKWLDNDLEWVTLLDWSAPADVLNRVREMFQDSRGYADWEAVSEHLASNEPAAFQVYLDSGNPKERIFLLTTPPREEPRPHLTLLQGGKES